jgi:iron complex outermembrane receptor protein
MSASVVALVLGGAAWAQDPAPAVDDSDEEVVVTSQKREQKLQDVPLSVTAFTAKTLADQSVQSLTNLSSKAPNVVLAPVGFSAFASAFYIRGLGFADVESSFEPSVGTEINGVYLTRNSGALMDFYDIQSVEILRGPQGTLYGRNTIGGLISLRTKRPDGTTSGGIQGTIGDHGRAEVRAAVNFALSDTLAARVSVLYKDYEGYNFNATRGVKEGNQETKAGRLTLVWTPTENFDATLLIDVDKEEGSGASFRNAGLPGNSYAALSPNVLTPGDDPYTTYGNLPIFSTVDTWGATLEMNYRLDTATITSVTGYREFDDQIASDYDASASALYRYHGQRTQTHWQFSEELRIASNGEGPWNYVAGIYYLDQSYTIANQQVASIPIGFPLQIINDTQRASQDNMAIAVFAQIDYNVTPELVLTVGGRYSYEEKDFTNDPLDPVSGATGVKTLPVASQFLAASFSNNWSDFSPKVGLSYKFNDDVMAYAQWQQGFRSGGFNGRANTSAAVGPFDAENVDAYELGLKSTLADGKVRLNLAAFRNEYSDMQTGTQGPILNASGQVIGFQSIVTNAASALVDGFEAELFWDVGSGFTFNANVGWLDARYDTFLADLTSDGVTNPTDNSDLPLPFAPKWSGAVGINWSHDFDFGTFSVNANAVYMDDVYTSGGTINRTSNIQVRDENTLIDATLALESLDGKWRVALWGKNLTDELIINNTFGLGSLGNLRVYSAPRTWGLDVGVNF